MEGGLGQGLVERLGQEEAEEGAEQRGDREGHEGRAEREDGVGGGCDLGRPDAAQTRYRHRHAHACAPHRGRVQLGRPDQERGLGRAYEVLR